MSKKLEILGNKIKQARIAIGMSQKDLARYLGVTDKSVSSYEVGRIKPPVKITKRLSVLTQKPLSYFDTSSLSKEDLLAKLKAIEVEIGEIKKLLKKVD